MRRVRQRVVEGDCAVCARCWELACCVWEYVKCALLGAWWWFSGVMASTQNVHIGLIVSFFISSTISICGVCVFCLV